MNTRKIIKQASVVPPPCPMYIIAGYKLSEPEATVKYWPVVGIEQTVLCVVQRSGDDMRDEVRYDYVIESQPGKLTAFNDPSQTILPEKVRVVYGEWRPTDLRWLARRLVTSHLAGQYPQDDWDGNHDSETVRGSCDLEDIDKV